MKRKKTIKTVLMVALSLGSSFCLGLLLCPVNHAHASYASKFAEEARLSKAEIFDSKNFKDFKLSKYKSAYVTQTSNKKVRNAGILFYSKVQNSKSFNHYAKHWVNIRSMKNGQIYMYTDKTIYGNYLVDYHVMSKNSSKNVKVGSTKVKVTYSKKNNVSFKYQGNTTYIHLNNGYVSLNRKKVNTKNARKFKAAISTTGSKSSQLVKDAKRYIGVPYRYVGRDPFGGLDCASFVNLVYMDVLHKDIGGMTGVQQRLGKHISPNKAKKGDLLFWVASGQSESYHVAMAIGHGKLIEEAGKSVHISSIKARQPQYAVAMHNN